MPSPPAEKSASPVTASSSSTAIIIWFFPTIHRKSSSIPSKNPIVLDPTQPTTFALDGSITQNGKVVTQLGIFNVADPSKLQKIGGTFLRMPPGATLQSANATVRSGFIERSNVDPATELTELMDTQRQLEANANMILIQDETLDKLVNDVGRVS